MIKKAILYLSELSGLSPAEVLTAILQGGFVAGITFLSVYPFCLGIKKVAEFLLLV